MDTMYALTPSYTTSKRLSTEGLNLTLSPRKPSNFPPLLGFVYVVNSLPLSDRIKENQNVLVTKSSNISI